MSNGQSKANVLKQRLAEDAADSTRVQRLDGVLEGRIVDVNVSSEYYEYEASPRRRKEALDR